jgi:pyruvate,water dikinase
VAVRSSATAEDLPEAAFAGQQETFLNIIGEKALLDAVRACWASLWSERAILYRAHQNVDQASVKLAVIVQKMVQADVAGVMFTAGPVSGARNELVIDASRFEAVVSGLVTPDHLVVNKRSLRVKEERLGRREIIIRSKAGGGTEQVTPTDKNTDAALSPSEVRSLTKLGIQIERHFGAPQDIEWAWVKDEMKPGKFLILQARPMTALPKPLKVTGPMRMVIPMLAEMWITRPYPLDVTTFTGTVERAIGNLLVVMIGKSAPDPIKSWLKKRVWFCASSRQRYTSRRACLSRPGSPYGARVITIRHNGRPTQSSSRCWRARTRSRNVIWLRLPGNKIWRPCTRHWP